MNWIKIEVTTPDKPEVIMMAETLGIDHDGVIGKLFRIWIWADQNTIAGDLVKVTAAFIDRLTGQPGFADAMRLVGWLRGKDGALHFPNFDRHNGASAKARAENNRRVKNHRERNGIRNGKRNGNVTVEPLQKPLPDQIRSDQIKDLNPPTPLSPESAATEVQDRRGLGSGSGSGSGSNEFSGQDLAELRRDLGQDFDRAVEWAKANARTNWIGFLAKTVASGRQPWRTIESPRPAPVGHNPTLGAPLPAPPSGLSPMPWDDYRAHVEASAGFTTQPDWWGLLKSIELGLKSPPYGVSRPEGLAAMPAPQPTDSPASGPEKARTGEVPA